MLWKNPNQTLPIVSNIQMQNVSIYITITIFSKRRDRYKHFNIYCNRYLNITYYTLIFSKNVFKQISPYYTYKLCVKCQIKKSHETSQLVLLFCEIPNSVSSTWLLKLLGVVLSFCKFLQESFINIVRLPNRIELPNKLQNKKNVIKRH